MHVTGKGILHHHFWGDYRASLFIGFDSPLEARLALESGLLPLGFEIGRPKQGGDPQKAACVLVWFGDRPALTQAIEKLVALGAEREKIDSVACSIDCGEPWSVELEVADPRQGVFVFTGEGS